MQMESHRRTRPVSFSFTRSSGKGAPSNSVLAFLSPWKVGFLNQIGGEASRQWLKFGVQGKTITNETDFC